MGSENVFIMFVQKIRNMIMLSIRMVTKQERHGNQERTLNVMQRSNSALLLHAWRIVTIPT
jgi:hypothetical protein